MTNTSKWQGETITPYHITASLNKVLSFPVKMGEGYRHFIGFLSHITLIYSPLSRCNWVISLLFDIFDVLFWRYRAGIL